MKLTISTLALISSVCLGAEIAPATPDIQPEAEVSLHSAQASQKAAEQASRRAERSARDAQKKLEMAQSRIAPGADEDSEPMEMRMFSGNGGGGFALAEAFGAPDRAGAQPLIVRTSATDPATLSNAQEDLTVMSRILTKAVTHDRKDSAMGIVLSALPGSRRPQSIYLEGYGALFLLSVKYPLVPAPAKEDEKAEKPVDTTWEKTKQELYGSRQGNIRVWDAASNAEPAAEYDPEQVEALKKDVLEALKNAANIRGLKPDESITVVVMGNRSGNGGTRTKRVVKAGPNNGGHGKADVVYSTGDGNRPGRESTLTIRVKKEDVDAFSKGSIDADELKKRAAISTY